MDIGNAIGKFLYANLKCLRARDKWVTWILIELGLYGGLPAHIDLAWDKIHIHQRLEFWCIPFSCLTNHTGHLMEQWSRKYWSKKKMGGS